MKLALENLYLQILRFSKIDRFQEIFGLQRSLIEIEIKINNTKASIL